MTSKKPYPSIPTIHSTASDLELTLAVARYVCGKENPGLTEPPYGSSLDCLAPLFCDKDYLVAHSAGGDICVTIYSGLDQPSVQGCDHTEARARCFALLRESGKVEVVGA